MPVFDDHDWPHVNAVSSLIDEFALGTELHQSAGLEGDTLDLGRGLRVRSTW
jgi:hypothetical protein